MEEGAATAKQHLPPTQSRGRARALKRKVCVTMRNPTTIPAYGPTKRSWPKSEEMSRRLCQKGQGPANLASQEQSLCHGMVTRSNGITKVVIQTDSDGPGFADVTKNRGSIQLWKERTALNLIRLTMALEAHNAPVGGKDSFTLWQRTKRKTKSINK
ncbi:hypothetical protein TNCV_4952331 [Trichonephila clavipes]|nr:hypothetical protein TNCV_4952331 [Trichonephila clavipes]